MKNNISVFSLEWVLTDACNLRCAYCNQKKTEFKETDYSKTVREILRIAPKYIWIGGGEPTLVKQLPAIVKELKANMKVHIGLNSNLTLINAAMAIIPHVDDFIVSLDTADSVASKKHRGVDPEVIIAHIEQLVELKRKHNYPVNITVNSVVHRDYLKGNGIKELNDKLYAIDPHLCHIFCPIFPEGQEGSIINDKKSSEQFFGIVDELKTKGRTIMVSFPSPGEQKEFCHALSACYRRYFRLMLTGNGMPFSPCPPADIADPECLTPCNCGAFIDDVVHFNDPLKVRRSLLAGKLSIQDVAALKKLHRDRMGLNIPDDGYTVLLNADEKKAPE